MLHITHTHTFTQTYTQTPHLLLAWIQFISIHVFLREAISLNRDPQNSNVCVYVCCECVIRSISAVLLECWRCVMACVAILSP